MDMAVQLSVKYNPGNNLLYIFIAIILHCDAWVQWWGALWWLSYVSVSLLNIVMHQYVHFLYATISFNNNSVCFVSGLKSNLAHWHLVAWNCIATSSFSYSSSLVDRLTCSLPFLPLLRMAMVLLCRAISFFFRDLRPCWYDASWTANIFSTCRSEVSRSWVDGHSCWWEEE